MPQVLVLGAVTKDGLRSVIKHKVASQYLALGILKQAELEPSPPCILIAEGDRILLCSDGVTEATNSSGEAFGSVRYEQAATEIQNSFQAVATALGIFCGEQPFNDDVSLVEIQCMPGLLASGAL